MPYGIMLHNNAAGSWPGGCHRSGTGWVLLVSSYVLHHHLFFSSLIIVIGTVSFLFSSFFFKWPSSQTKSSHLRLQTFILPLPVLQHKGLLTPL